MSVLRRALSALRTECSSKRSTLGYDLAAGVTVGVMLVPQAMGYALLAGLPPVVGLYASTIPLIAYAVFGTSRHLAVGPVAVVSLLVLSEASGFAAQGSPEYLGIVVLLALVAGIAQCVGGLLRLGQMTNFMSHAVTSGFTSAAAIIICLSQVPPLIGARSHGSPHGAGIAMLLDAPKWLQEVDPVTLIVGLGALGVLLLFRRWLPRFPAPMLMVVATTIIAYALRPSHTGMSIVGVVPQGLPAFALPPMNLELMARLLPTALTISLVSYLESIAIARLIAARERYKVDPDRELVALGLANVATAFSSGYPVSGSFSRTAVNHGAGARTKMAGVVCALVVLGAMYTLTPLFYYLPKATLAAIVIAAAVGLVNVGEARRFFRVKAGDGWSLVLTFAATLVWGAQTGIIAGVIFSLSLFIWRSAHPYMAELGYVKEDESFRDIRYFPDAQIFPDVLVLRIDASLTFANMGFVEDRITELLARRPKVAWTVLDLAGVNDIDGIAIGGLEAMIEAHSASGVRFALAGAKGQVRSLLTRAGWEEKYPELVRHKSLAVVLREIGKWQDVSALT